MRKIRLLSLALMSLFLTSTMVAQVTETFTAGTASNYLNNVNKVDWNWARMWVEDNTTTAKITHGVNIFNVANVESQMVINAKFKFHFEKITTGTLPATIEIYYKTPYTGYKASEVNYPEGCTVLGTVELTEGGMDYEFTNEMLKTYVQTQIDAGESAVLFMRSITPDVKLSFFGSLGYPTLDVDLPQAASFAPSATVKNINGDAKDYWGMTSKDTLSVDFSKSMNTASVEEKISFEPASIAPTYTWQGDTIVLITLEGLTEASSMTMTIADGTLAADGSAMKKELVKDMEIFYDNVIRSVNNFWNLNGENKTNALSVANTDLEGSINDRKAFIYLDLAGTTSETDFKGLVIKCFDHQDAATWTKMPISETNQDYKLYDVTYPDLFGLPFNGTTYDGLTTTLIDDIKIDSTYTVYTYNSDKIINYLKDNAGKQVCIAIVDETPATAEEGKPTIWISDPSNNPDQGAPVVVYSDVKDNTSTKDIAAADKMKLYPMPVSNGVINIAGVKASQVELFSVSGQLMMTSKVLNNAVNVSNLKSGLYLIRVNSDAGSFVKQIVLQ